MLKLQKVHNKWSKLTVTGVSAKQSVEISRIGSLVKSENCNRTASPPPDLAHCGGGVTGKEKFPKNNNFFSDPFPKLKEGISVKNNLRKKQQ